MPLFTKRVKIIPNTHKSGSILVEPRNHTFFQFMPLQFDAYGWTHNYIQLPIYWYNKVKNNHFKPNPWQKTFSLKGASSEKFGSVFNHQFLLVKIMSHNPFRTNIKFTKWIVQVRLDFQKIVFSGDEYLFKKFNRK